MPVYKYRWNELDLKMYVKEPELSRDIAKNVILPKYTLYTKYKNVWSSNICNSKILETS